MNNYPWKIGDLALYFDDTNVPRIPENSKKAIIVAFTDSWLDHIEILVDGKVISVLRTTLQIPPVKKVKANFGIKN